MARIGSFLGFGTKPSDAASHFQRILEESDIGEVFYGSLVAFFMSFDEHNQRTHNKFVSNDIKYIVKCTTDDITSFINSKRSLKRVDGYFYIYHRVEQCLHMLKQNDATLAELQQKLFELLASKFKSTDGKEPHIYLNDRDVLQDINIFQHLPSVTIADEHSLYAAFALFKLSIQSSVIIHSHQNRLKWKDLLTKVRDIKFSLEDFVKRYLKCKDAFQQCPLDASAFIYLIQKLRSLKSTKLTSYTTLVHLAQSLKLDMVSFYKDFQPIFDNDIKTGRFQEQHIREFLLTLSLYDDLFLEYLTIYSSNVPFDNLWQLFLDLNRISTLNGTMKKHLSAILTKRVSAISLATFRQCVTSAKEHSTKINRESRPHFLEVFERIYDAFILSESQKKRSVNPLTDRQFKELLNVDASLIPIDHFTRPSNLLVIHQLLFRSDPSAPDFIHKIQRLFSNLEEFNANICQNQNPTDIIEDEWLTDFLPVIPQTWIKLDQNAYKYLCNHHQNNRWTIYVWSRIIQLTLTKNVQESVNPTLVKLNDWMKIVGHDVFQPNDILTILFVKNLFEMFIVKYIKLIVLLPNIETIINFVMAIKEKQPTRISGKDVDEFVQRSRQELDQIFRLKGKCIS